MLAFHGFDKRCGIRRHHRVRILRAQRQNVELHRAGLALFSVHLRMSEKKNNDVERDDDECDVRPSPPALILMCNRDDEHSNAPNAPQLAFKLWGKNYPGQSPSSGELQEILSSIVNVPGGTPCGI